MKIPFTGLIQLLFVVLKVSKQVNWSWFWVLSPTWIPIAMALVIVFSALLLAIFRAG